MHAHLRTTVHNVKLYWLTYRKEQTKDTVCSFAIYYLSVIFTQSIIMSVSNVLYQLNVGERGRLNMREEGINVGTLKPRLSVIKRWLKGNMSSSKNYVTLNKWSSYKMENYNDKYEINTNISFWHKLHIIIHTSIWSI